ncbi:MAG: type II 3-dehydroquinate dehydratase [Eubacteriales bacterium]
MKNILIINGPNLNFLGIREKSVYGNQTYDDLLEMIAKKGEESDTQIEVFQSNHEGAIIDKIQEAYHNKTEALLINAGAFTHYSYAIRDALASIMVPKVEVHISDITKREEFRKTSVIEEVCDKQIMGKGLAGYIEAIDFVLDFSK